MHVQMYWIHFSQCRRGVSARCTPCARRRRDLARGKLHGAQAAARAAGAKVRKLGPSPALEHVRGLPAGTELATPPRQSVT